MSLAVTVYRQRFWLIPLLVIGSLFLFLAHSPRSKESGVSYRDYMRAKDSSTAAAASTAAALGQHNRQRQAGSSGFSSDPAEFFVQATLQKNRMVVFSKSTCPHCMATKSVLDRYRAKHGLNYTVVEVDLRNDRDDIERALRSLYERTTFPSVFIDGQCIGGNDDIQRLETLDTLAQVLAKKGLLNGDVEDSARKFISDTIKNYQVALFTIKGADDKETSDHLDKFAAKHNLTYTTIRLDEKPSFLALRERLFKISGKDGFPITYIGKLPWGGKASDIPYFMKNGVIEERMEYMGLVTKTAAGAAPTARTAIRNEELPDFPQAARLTGKGFVSEFVAHFDVAVFGKASCPYSKALASLLEDYGRLYGLKYHWVDVEQRNDSDQIKAELKRISGLDTFPNMFVKHTSLGGNDSVYAKHVAGELQELLDESALLDAEKVKGHEAKIYEQVRNQVRDNHVVVYGKSFDRGTARAVQIFQRYKDRYHAKYTFEKIDGRADHQQLTKAIERLAGKADLPAVFVGGKEVGGIDGLQRLYDGGELKSMLIKAKLIEAGAEQDDIAVQPLPPTKGPSSGGKDEKEDPAQTPAERKIRQLIRRNRVMVFSKTYCPYSKRAKALLAKYKSDRGLDFAVLEADLEADPMAVKAALNRISGRATFPNVFVDGRSIGGSDDIQLLHKNGELAALLQKKSLIV